MTKYCAVQLRAPVRVTVLSNSAAAAVTSTEQTHVEKTVWEDIYRKFLDEAEEIIEAQ